MIVVSNTSPIINLAQIGRLDILEGLFTHIIIPSKVFEEITVQGMDMPGADEVRAATWIQVAKPTDTNFVKTLQLQIDGGESEAIVLALELKAGLLVIDERLGRAVAKEFQVPIIGLLGVLKIAKAKGIITAVKPLIDQLIHVAGFRVAKDLYDEIMATEGE